MAIATAQPSSSYLSRSPNPSGLADVLNILLDKGIVIDAYVRVSLVGIELLTIDARIVIASVDTYLRFAEAVDRLNIEERDKTLPDLLDKGVESGAAAKTRGALSGVRDKAENAVESGKEKVEAGKEKVKERVGRDDE